MEHFKHIYDVQKMPKTFLADFVLTIFHWTSCAIGRIFKLQ